MFNKELALQALRSGEFKQHRMGIHNALHQNSSESYKYATAFCCIGVMGKANDCLTNSTYQTGAILDIRGKTLSDEASKYLKSKGVDLHNADVLDALINLNDLKQWNFDQIADFVEVAL